MYKMKTNSILYIIILVTIELLSVTVIKQWSISNNNIFLTLGLLGYLIVGGFFAYILHIHSEMTVINSLWQVMNIILVSVIGLFIYKEKLTLIQTLGVICAVIATVLLSIE